MKKILGTCGLLLLCAAAKTQTFHPEWGDVFLQDEIPTVHITIDPDSLAEMLLDENLFSDYEYPASFVYQTSFYSDTIDLIGFRLRGNTSRLAAKKSFKVSFNTFVDQQKYKGLKKMNLNGEHNDVSILRSRLNWESARTFDVPASRTNHVRLYVNGEYRGLYLNVEQIDNRYLNERFAASTGNLYKCFYGSNLAYLGEDPDIYKLAPWGNRIYELKTNTEDDDYSGLAHFIDVLNNTPLQDLPCELEEVFNVHDYLKAAALEILWGHWDGYIYNNNNYYLYDNPDDGRFHFIPYDLDNTLGIDWLGLDWSERNIYDWDNNEPRPLFSRLMLIEEYRSEFTWQVNEAIETVFNPDVILERAEILQVLIEDAALEDDYKELDYGFTDTDFQNALYEAFGAHVGMSISEYVEIRTNSALDQLETLLEPFVVIPFDNAPWTSGEVDLLAFAGTSASFVQATINPSSGSSMIVDMFDDGLHQDLAANDGWFGAQIQAETSWDSFTYQIMAGNGQETDTAPCEPQLVWSSWLGNGLVINEVMPSNTSNIADEFGEYDDWIELFNAGSTSQDLSNYYLTNKLEEANKWRLPLIILSPGEFALLWLDDQSEQGPSHGNFNLNASLDDVALVAKNLEAWRTVDYVEFENIATDESYGRETDGNLPWIVFNNPTPNGSNNSIGIKESAAVAFVVYPSPTTGELHFDRPQTGNVVNMQGQKMMEFREQSRIDLSTLYSGLYIIHTSAGIARIVKD